MISYIKELPEHVSLSNHLKELADGYIAVQVFGKTHYVPLTKEIKKQFHVQRKKDRIFFKNSSDDDRLEDMIRVIADSLYLQTRDTVGAEIRESVVKIVKDRIEDLLSPIAQKEIEQRFEEKDRLLKDKNE